MRRCMAILAVSLLAFAPTAAKAACTGTNHLTKQRQTVQEIYRSSSHPKRYFAEATHDPKTGRPVIIYYGRYSSAPGYFKSFVRAHECCHHAGNRNEIAANCCALRRMGLSKSGLAALERYIVSRDVNSETARDYEGQGFQFWTKTANQCLSR